MNRRCRRVVLAALTLPLLAVAGVLPAAAGDTVVTCLPLEPGRTTVHGHDINAGCNTFTTTVLRWAAVAVVPHGVDGGWVDYDLAVTESGPSGPRVASSQYGGDAIDFVAIDHGHRPTGTFAAHGTHYTGHGYYSVAYAESGGVLPLVAPLGGYALNQGEQVRVLDLPLRAGQCVAIRAWNFTHNTAVVAIMASDPAIPTTLAQGRGTAAVQAGSGPSGPNTVTITFTAPRSDRYGLVITNRREGGLTPDTALRYTRLPC
jgi:hypothetical protein